MNKTKTLRLLLGCLLTVVLLNPAQSEAQTKPQPSLKAKRSVELREDVAKDGIAVSYRYCDSRTCYFRYNRKKLRVQPIGGYFPSFPGNCLAELALTRLTFEFMNGQVKAAKEIRLTDLILSSSAQDSPTPRIAKAKIWLDGKDLSNLLAERFLLFMPVNGHKFTGDEWCSQQ